MTVQITCVRATHIANRQWTVLATGPEGEEYIHYRNDLTETGACYLAGRVSINMKINPDHWFVRFPYGSVAWQKNACEQDWIERERDLEDGWGL